MKFVTTFVRISEIMGQKVNPVIFRIGQTEEWKSRWFSRKNFKDFLKQDVAIRDFLASKLIKAGVDRIEIEDRPTR